MATAVGIESTVPSSTTAFDIIPQTDGDYHYISVSICFLLLVSQSSTLMDARHVGAITNMENLPSFDKATLQLRNLTHIIYLLLFFILAL